jgi:hypothetical protein
MLNRWIDEGLVIDPYRALYPDAKEISYVSFRGRNERGGGVNFGKTRLDFFLVSPGIIDWVKRVRYEDRIGSDFDHKEVVMEFGGRSVAGKMVIKDSTLTDIMVEDLGWWVVYDCISHNLQDMDRNLENNLIQYDILLKEKENLIRMESMGGREEELVVLQETNNMNMQTVKNRFPLVQELLRRELRCTKKTLYEIITLGVKSKLMGVQKRRREMVNLRRERLIQKEDYMKRKFGDESQQRMDVREEILRLDDVLLRERATKFKEFLDKNNEKATKAFCRLSKEGGICDDITQIRDGAGVNFVDAKGRGKHIREYYTDIYKRRLDRLMSIEDFIGNNMQEGWLNEKKLTRDEMEGLEAEVNIDEVKKALDGSNFESSSGWDGLSFKVIRKLWEVLKFPMLEMIRETFNTGELMESYKLGLIRLIPKKGDAKGGGLETNNIIVLWL